MAKAGDIFCLWFAPEQVWIALQVWKPLGIPERRPDETDIDKMNRKSTGVMLLDWHSPDFPTQNDVQRMQPFRRSDSRIMQGAAIRGFIDGDIPPYCRYAGHREVLPSPYGGGYTTLWNLAGTYHWAHHPMRVPEAIRTLLIQHNNYKDTPFTLPDGTPISGRLKESSPAGTLDLRHTYLQELDVCTDGLDALYLPPTLVHLRLSGSPKDGFTIEAFDEGRRITLRTQGQAMYLSGLRRLYAYEADTAMDAEVDMAQLAACYPQLYSLRIWGEFGTVTHLSAAGVLGNLRQLQVTGFYGFTGEALPKPEAFPALGMLIFTDVPKAALDVIRKRYKGRRDMDISFGSGRTEAWLRENRDNPLRCWQGREGFPPAKAKRAANLYKALRQEATAASDASARLGIFEKAAADFYRLDKKGEFLETIELEELHAAIAQLLEELAIPEEERESLLAFFDGMMP